MMSRLTVRDLMDAFQAMKPVRIVSQSNQEFNRWIEFDPLNYTMTVFDHGSEVLASPHLDDITTAYNNIQAKG